LLAAVLLVPLAAADEPAPVRPTTGTFSGLRRASTVVAVTAGENLDKGHDWLYRRLQRFLANVDTRYSAPERAPVLVPLSPLRIGFDTELLRRRGGWLLSASPDFEATLRLPNIEQRLRIFISSNDLRESPRNPALERNPIRAGVRFEPRSHVDFDVGMRLRVKPSMFVALKWTPDFNAGVFHAYPFAKTYVETGLGLGVSSGVTLELRRGLWIARSSTYANWMRNTTATDWSQTFVLGYARAVIQEGRYDRLATGHDLACGAALHLTVSGDRASRATVYESSLLFKRPLHGGWLYGYVEPVVRWERASDWHPAAGIRIGVDALFWGLAKRPAEVASYCR
jgi:hypothetical protein